MNKLVVILNEDNRTLDTVIQVCEYDEKFPPLLSAVTQEWRNAEEDVEYYDLLCRRASEAGYKILFPEFMTYAC